MTRIKLSDLAAIAPDLTIDVELFEGDFYLELDEAKASPALIAWLEVKSNHACGAKADPDQYAPTESEKAALANWIEDEPHCKVCKHLAGEVDRARKSRKVA